MSQAAGLGCDLTKRSAHGAQAATLCNWLCTRVCACVCEEKIEWQEQVNVSSLNIDQCSNLSTLQQHLGNDSSLILCARAFAAVPPLLIMYDLSNSSSMGSLITALSP